MITPGPIASTVKETVWLAEVESASVPVTFSECGPWLRPENTRPDVQLAMAGSDERVVAWAAEHHEPEERWTVPVDAGRLLVAADDEEL